MSTNILNFLSGDICMGKVVWGIQGLVQVACPYVSVDRVYGKNTLSVLCGVVLDSVVWIFLYNVSVTVYKCNLPFFSSSLSLSPDYHRET